MGARRAGRHSTGIAAQHQFLPARDTDLRDQATYRLARAVQATHVGPSHRAALARIRRAERRRDQQRVADVGEPGRKKAQNGVGCWRSEPGHHRHLEQNRRSIRGATTTITMTRTVHHVQPLDESAQHFRGMVAQPRERAIVCSAVGQRRRRIDGPQRRCLDHIRPTSRGAHARGHRPRFDLRPTRRDTTRRQGRNEGEWRRRDVAKPISWRGQQQWIQNIADACDLWSINHSINDISKEL